MYHILTVDDDIINNRLITLLLTEEGHRVTAASSAMEALEYIDSNTYDLILLDVMMPDMHGIMLCTQIRQRVTTPIIFISALNQTSDKVKGLQAGGDDYISKPFDAAEMVARTWTALRRNERHVHNTSMLVTPDFVLDSVENEVTLVHKGKRIRLTPIEARLLRFLGNNPGQTLSRDTILLKALGYSYTGESNQLDVYIKRLRGKIEDDPSNPKLLLTVRRVGYRYQPSTRYPQPIER